MDSARQIALYPGEDGYWVAECPSLHYAPRLAFVPEPGWRGYEANFVYNDQPVNSPVLLWGVRVGLKQRRLWQGGLLDEGISVGTGVYLRNQTAVSPQVDLLRRPPHTDRTVSVLVQWNITDAFRSGSALCLVGNQNGGRSVYLFVEQGLEPLPRFRLKLTAEQLHIRYPDRPRDFATQAILTVNYELDAERVIGARWVVNRIEGGGQAQSANNLYLTYLQRLRSGLEVYLLFGAPNADRTRNRFALKIVSPLEL